MEGRGSATIHDVTLSKAGPRPPFVVTPTPELNGIEVEYSKVKKALARAESALRGLEGFLNSLSTGKVDVAELASVVAAFDRETGKLDSRVLELEAEAARLKQARDELVEQLSGPPIDDTLSLNASIGIHADVEGEVEVALLYGMYKACYFI